jgi:hypothetical protein
VNLALRAEALRQARETTFDAIELAGLAFALLVVVSATRYSAIGLGMAERFGAMIANFLVAIPLLAVLAGPFYLRRNRRGLRIYLKKQAEPKRTS